MAALRRAHGAAAITWLIGYGDIAARVARRLLERGETVCALSRQFADPPGTLVTHRADLDAPDTLPPVSGRAVYTAPPPRDGATDPRIGHWLDRCEALEAIVYVSTSGVYGDCGGDWVSEQRLPAPQTDRARRRLDAERRLQAWAAAHGTRLAILRVPGIYGPGRLPLDRLRQGRPVLAPAESPWSNRIHAEDLAAACVLALDTGEGVYNISDGTPSRMSDYFLACARRFGLPVPRLIDRAQAEREFSPQLLSFYRESRRLGIDKARRELGFTPQYPDLASGLAACDIPRRLG